MNESTIIVTGGCGYIGSHTVVELAINGYNVISIDNYSRSSPTNLKNINKIIKLNPISNVALDLTNHASTFEFFSKITKPFSVIHFAAFKSVAESIKNPSGYYRNNVMSLLNTLDAAVKYQASDFIFSSSCSVYGNISNLPVDESTPLSEPQSPYAFTKVIGESIVKDYFKTTGMNSIILRYFNPVGSHSSGLIGETPYGKASNLFPVLTQTLIGNRKSMHIYGGSLDTRDGSCIRDYIHVTDIAKGHISALKYLRKKKKCFEIFNLGSENGISVFEAITMLESITKKKLNYQVVNPREGDVIQIFSNCEKARYLLGWEAKYDLTEMIRTAWNWELELANRSTRKRGR